MPWKTRGGRRYYYTSEREGGRVISRYVGSSAAAHAVASLQELGRERRELEAIDRRERRKRAERLSVRIDRACQTRTTAAGAIPTAAAYHRHNRGPWRRRRAMTNDAAQVPATIAASTADLATRCKAG